MLKKYLLSSVAFRPEDGLGAGDTPEDERIEVDLADDDETSNDPQDEPSDEAQDDEPDGADGDDVDAADGAGAADNAPSPSRGSRQFAELRERNRELARQNAENTRRIDELTRRPAQQHLPEDPRAEADRLALMSPEERISYTVDKALKANEAKTQQLTNQLLDQSDSTNFNSLMASQPLARKLGPAVEKELAGLRANGQNLPRQVILAQLIGQRVLSQNGKGKKPAQERRQRETTRPSNPRGDAPPDRRERRTGGDLAAMERRLENQQI